MNNEELKLVLDTIREVAGTAGTVGIVWVVIHYFVMLMQAIAVPMLTAWVFWRVCVAGFDAYRTPRVVRHEFKLDNLVINSEVAEDLKRVLGRVRNSIYIHEDGVKKLNAALDMYESAKSAQAA